MKSKDTASSVTFEMDQDPLKIDWRQQLGARETLTHLCLAHQETISLGIKPPCRAKFCDLFQKIVMRIEEEGKPRREGIDRHDGPVCGLNIGICINLSK